MKVRFKMTNKGEVAILPRKEFEALAAKALEADEDVSTARGSQVAWQNAAIYLAKG